MYMYMTYPTSVPRILLPKEIGTLYSLKVYYMYIKIYTFQGNILYAYHVCCMHIICHVMYVCNVCTCICMYVCCEPGC